MPDETTKTVHIDYVSHGLNEMGEQLKANQAYLKELQILAKEGTAEQAASARYQLKEAGIPIEHEDAKTGKVFKEIEQTGHTLFRSMTGLNLEFASLAAIVGFLAQNYTKYQAQNAEVERSMFSLSSAYGDSYRTTGISLQNTTEYAKQFGQKLGDVNAQASTVGQSFLGLGLKFQAVDPLDFLFGKKQTSGDALGLRDLQLGLMGEVLQYSTALSMPMDQVINYMTTWGRRYNIEGENQLQTVHNLADMGEKAGYGYKRFLKDLASIDDTAARYNFRLNQTASDLTHFTEAIKEGKLSLSDFTNILTGAGKMQMGQMAFLMQDTEFRENIKRIGGAKLGGQIEEAYRTGDSGALAWLYKEVYEKHQAETTKEAYKVVGRIAGVPEGKELDFTSWTPHQKFMATSFIPSLGLAGIDPKMGVGSIEAAMSGIAGLGTAPRALHVAPGEKEVGLKDLNKTLMDGFEILTKTKAWTAVIEAEIAQIFVKTFHIGETPESKEHRKEVAKQSIDQSIAELGEYTQPEKGKPITINNNTKVNGIIPEHLEDRIKKQQQVATKKILKEISKKEAYNEKVKKQQGKK